jgi:glycosyltransferase involved in cell wall biosynthesis
VSDNENSALPRVSVVILSHRFDLALEAARSIKAQSYPNIEIVWKYHEAYWPEKFNEAWAAASGKYLVFLPDDDTLEPEFAARHVAEAERATADLVFSDFYVTGKLRLKWHLPAFDAEVLRVHCVPFMTFLVRREFWENLPNGTHGARGGWDGNQAYSDWDADIRMYQAHAKAVHLRGEFLWTRAEHAKAGSRLMDDAAHAAALRALRDKHSAMAQSG